MFKYFYTRFPGLSQVHLPMIPNIYIFLFIANLNANIKQIITQRIVNYK
jgi:hypothetical protein